MALTLVKEYPMKQTLSMIVLFCALAISGFSQNTSRKNLAVRDVPPRTSATADALSRQATPTAADEFVIGPEDVLQILVWHEPELSSPRVLVRPDGKIGIPLLNDVQASGLTPKQLQAKITEGVKAFVADPNVSVIVVEIHSQIAYVAGAVGRPGPYPLTSPTTIMELLVRAGGLAEFAKSEDIAILRKEGDKQSRYRFNYKSFSEGRDYKQNFQLRTGDIVIVP